MFNDLTSEQREKLGFKTLPGLQDHAKTQCRALYLCRYTATASKHWRADNKPDPTVQVVVAHEGGWVIYFVDDGKKTPAEQVFEAARDFWYAFICEHGIAKRLDDRIAG